MYINAPSNKTVESAKKYRNSQIQNENKAFLATKLYIGAFFIGFLLLMYILISNAEVIRSILS